MYEKSLRVYKAIEYLRAFWLGSMISILFLKYVGMIDSEIALFHFIMGVLMFSLEIPTGSFADRYGYRKSIILSFIFLALAFASFLAATIFGSWVILVLTSLFFALSNSFKSGAGNSYVYKIFENKGEKEEYIEYQSVLRRDTMILEGVAILIGSHLYSLDERLPYFIQFVLVSFAVLLSLRLKNEPRNTANGKIVGSIKKGFQEFFSNKLYFAMVVFLVLFETPFQYFHNVINQSIFVEVGFSVKEIGVVGFVSYFLASFLLPLFPKLWKLLGETKLYLIFPLFVLASFILLVFLNSQTYIVLLTIILYFIFRSNGILVDYSLQQRVNDEIRATMLSVVNMFAALPMRLLFIGLAIAFAGKSYVESFYVIGIMFTSLTLLYVIFILRRLINLNGIRK